MRLEDRLRIDPQPLLWRPIAAIVAACTGYAGGADVET
jgi:hypothetical protein